MSASEVRTQLVDALRLDLVGPDDRLGSPSEVLSQAPSRWYLTGFLVPLDAQDTQRVDEDSNDELDAAADAGGTDDATPTEPASARKRFLPSSIGLSVLVPEATRHLKARVRWGDYKLRKPAEGPGDTPEWERTDRLEEVELELPRSTRKPRETDVNNSSGLNVALSVRPVAGDGAEGGLPRGARSVSVFLVNRRDPAPDETRDEAFAFQAQLEVECEQSFVPRPNLRSLGSDDWDERVADLQYRDACEFAVVTTSPPRPSSPIATAASSALAGFPRPKWNESLPPNCRTSSRLSDLFSSYFQGVGNYFQGPGRPRDYSLEFQPIRRAAFRTHPVRHVAEYRCPSHDWVVSR